MGSIRLACMFCEREDFDFVETTPDTWSSIEEVQSYEASIEEADISKSDVSVLDWFTHLGVCPECQARELESVKAEGSE